MGRLLDISGALTLIVSRVFVKVRHNILKALIIHIRRTLIMDWLII